MTLPISFLSDKNSIALFASSKRKVLHMEQIVYGRWVAGGRIGKIRMVQEEADLWCTAHFNLRIDSLHCSSDPVKMNEG